MPDGGTPAFASPFDVDPDGRFLGLTTDIALLPQYHVVVNWLEELTRRVPVK